MTKPSPLVTILQWLIVLLIPVFIITGSLNIFMSTQFVEWQYSRADFPPASLFTPEARLQNSLETLSYVRGQRTLEQLRGLNVYNEREIKHLVDVVNVTRVVFLLQPLSLALLLVATYVLYRSPATRVAAGTAVMYGGILTLIVIGAIGLFSLVAFDAFFVTFHRMFFEGDTWLFNQTDSLIQFYPLPFWTATAYGIALFCLAVALFFTALGWYMRRQAIRYPQATF
jgi:integral membrane protein (TIGR01906 family)